MDTKALKDAITRAAVAWERACHEHVAKYETKSIKVEEDALIAAVTAYNAAILQADAGTVREDS